MSENKIKFLAYYLPQYHPIPENDKWWGKGFTEWTNVTKAKPLFKGHSQPILPADLGFYDLRVPEVQEQQSEMALKYGIDGFIYYQYWFGNGKMLLEKPAEGMLKNNDIKIPFCFCWANETWKGIWHGLDNPDILVEQTYPGEQDYNNYFNYLLPFFKDERYIKVDNKPLFHIYRIEDIPDLNTFIKLFNSLAIQNGFEGVCFVATVIDKQFEILENDFVYGCVGVDILRKMRYAEKQPTFTQKNLYRLRSKIRRILKKPQLFEGKSKPIIINYEKAILKFSVSEINNKYIPCVFPNWDNSPRSGKKSLIFINSNPESWAIHLRNAIDILLRHKENPQMIIIKSWNEWAEGNYLEPDQKFGLRWLEVVKIIKNDI